jgi:GntR family transcriptional regulator
MDAQQIAEKIEVLIAAGAEGYEYGKKLLNVRELGAQEGVSAQTASAAYQALALRGLVRISKKSGTWVIGSKTTKIHLGTFDSAPDWTLPVWSTDDENDVKETTLYKVGISEANGLTEWGIADGTQIVERHYVKRVNGAPVQHKVTVLPYDRAVAMPQDPGYSGMAPMMTPVGHPIVSPPSGINMSQWLGWDVEDYTTEFGDTKMGPESAEIFGVPAGTIAMGSFCMAKTRDGETVFVVITTQAKTAKFTITHK